MKGTRVTFILLALAALGAPGCASSLRVSSAPPGAKILIDGQDTGYRTPEKIRPRKVPSGLHTISVALDGYDQAESKPIETSLSASLVIWSLIWPPALFVNLFKGFSETEPGSVHFELRRGGAITAAPTPVPGPPAATAGVLDTFTGDRRRIAQSGRKCAAMPLKTKDIAEQMTFVADELLLTELQQSGFEAIGPDDVNAMLGFEKTREAAGCDQASCAAEIGNALGVDFLAAGSVAALEGSLVLTLKLIDVKNSRVLARTNRVTDRGQKGLPRLIAEAVSDLVEKSGL